MNQSINQSTLFPPETQPNRVGRCDQTGWVGVVWVGLRATSKHLRKSNRVGAPCKTDAGGNSDQSM